MFLSVLVAVYNAEKYLDRCIESIVSQSFKDFELILVNDGSTDLSLQKCKQWKMQFPELIKLINKDNTGSLLTRRRCLEEANGKYIYIMDADDYLLNNDMFKIIEETINKHECDMVLFNAITSNTEDMIYPYPYRDSEVFEGTSLNKLYEQLVEGDNLNSLWNKVFSRNIVDWDFDYNKYAYIKNGTDFFQVIPIIMKAKKVVYLEEKYYCYQTDSNDTSIVHRYNPDIYISLRAGYLRLCNELVKNGKINKCLESKLYRRYLMIVSTAVYKIRLSKDNEQSKCEYLKNIRDDILFQDIYKKCSINEIQLNRRIIIELLYRKRYKLLIFLIKMCKY